jgi:urease accessory protein
MGMATETGAGEALLAALQLGDSALPIGRFVHSHGVEAWLAANPDAGEAEIAELVETTVTEAVAPLDGAGLAHAHRAGTLAELVWLDRALTARKAIAPARAASQACGRQLAALAGELSGDGLVAALAAAVRGRETDGNLAVVEGVLARALGIACADAVLVELRGGAGALLSAAVRLGRLAPARAQAAMYAMAPALQAAARAAAAAPAGELRSTGPELEIHALNHRRADARLFST